MKNIALPDGTLRLLALLSLVVLVACGDPVTPQLKESKTWQTTVMTVREQTLTEQYTTIGSIAAVRNVNLSSRISSYISQLNAQEGEAVEEGQLLIVLDDKELGNQINQARAAVEAAQAVLTDVSKDLNRFNELLEQGSISENRVRKTQLQKSTAEENLNGARATLSLAESQRQYTQIRSPATGIVTKRHLQVGSLATPGMPLLSIESRDQLKFETFVAESQLGNIEINDTVELDIDNIDQTIIGTIKQIIYAGDPIARSYKVNIALPTSFQSSSLDTSNSEENNTKSGNILSSNGQPGNSEPSNAEPGKVALYTGMFGRAIFVIGHSENLTIPNSALVEKGGLLGVYVIDAENKAWYRWLRIRRSWPGKVEIAAGISAGEKIVTTVPEKLREGDFIEATSSETGSSVGRVISQETGL